MQAPYIFLSHSSKDEEQTAFVAELLRAAGLNCWVDVADIPIGSTWPREIELGVDGCAALLVIFTERARDSEWVLAETLRAIDLRRPVITLRFDDTPLPLHLITRQASDFRKRRASAGQRLIGTLKDLLAAGASAPDGDAKYSPDPNRHNFFKYIEQLPGGAENAKVARELYAWARAKADNVSFSGRSNPGFHAHVEIGLGGVVFFSLRAYPKQPAVEVPLQYFMEFPPFDEPGPRRQALAAINALLPANAQLDESRADRRPTVPLTVLAEPGKREAFEALLVEIVRQLRRGGR